LSLASQLNQAWLRRGALACVLWPLSALMRALVALRRLAYHRGWMRSERLPVPVLVVGNRVVGGAGKTPTTIALLQYLKAQGWQPGVLSRGYKAKGQPAGHVLIDFDTAQGLNAQDTGDEPLLIWRRTGVPVMVGRERAAGGHALLKAHPEVNLLVCDDGLQHLALQRDIEIVVFDERGTGNGWLLPAGPLREPIDAAPPQGLCAAPIVLYNASSPSTRLRGHLARRSLADLVPLDDWWQGRASGHTFTAATLPSDAPPAWALAGIAHPQRFFAALVARGLRIHRVGLDDHADFGVLPWPRGVGHVIVTEKDAVKLEPTTIAAQRPGCRVWVAALDFRPEDSFWVALDAALASLAAPALTGLPDGHTTH
jgi:tetraacyldisaccharide 4'-kinase